MKPEKSSLTLLTMVLGFLLLYAIFDTLWLLWTATSIAALGVLSTRLGSYLAGGWYLLGEGLGKITGPIILCIVFFGVLLPVAILFRLMGKDNLMIKKDYKTTFLSVTKSFSKGDFEKVW